MVIVECPFCLGSIPLAEDENSLACEECSIRIDIARDEPGRLEEVALAA